MHKETYVYVDLLNFLTCGSTKYIVLKKETVINLAARHFAKCDFKFKVAIALTAKFTTHGEAIFGGLIHRHIFDQHGWRYNYSAYVTCAL